MSFKIANIKNVYIRNSLYISFMPVALAVFYATCLFSLLVLVPYEISKDVAWAIFDNYRDAFNLIFINQIRICKAFYRAINQKEGEE